MHHWKPQTLALVAILIFAEAPAFAQGMPGMEVGEWAAPTCVAPPTRERRCAAIPARSSARAQYGAGSIDIFRRSIPAADASKRKAEPLCGSEHENVR